MLSACSTLTPPKQTPVGPPVQYMQDCPEPLRPDPLTNGTLVMYAKGLRDSLRECNTDKAALRTWAASIDKLNKD